MNRPDRRRYIRNWKHLDLAKRDLFYWVRRLGPCEPGAAKRLRGALLRIERTQLILREVYQSLGYRFPPDPDLELGRYVTKKCTGQGAEK